MSIFYAFGTTCLNCENKRKQPTTNSHEYNLTPFPLLPKSKIANSQNLSKSSILKGSMEKMSSLLTRMTRSFSLWASSATPFS